MIQALIDRYYVPAWDRIWAGVTTQAEADEAWDRAQKAWDRAAARIKKETGYTL
jgi:hypothetical protein